MTIHLGRPLPDASRDRPGRRLENMPCRRANADMPSLFGLAPGGVCHAAPVTRRAVRSYRTLSPLPIFAEASSGKPFVALAEKGGFLSVALSLGLPPPDVIRHRVSVEPGLSSPQHARGHIEKRSSSHLTQRRS